MLSKLTNQMQARCVGIAAISDVRPQTVTVLRRHLETCGQGLLWQDDARTYAFVVTFQDACYAAAGRKAERQAAWRATVGLDALPATKLGQRFFRGSSAELLEAVTSDSSLTLIFSVGL